MRTKEEIKERLELLNFRERYGLGGAYATAIAELEWVLNEDKKSATNDKNKLDTMCPPVDLGFSEPWEQGARSL